MTAGAPAAKPGPKSDDQTGNAHDSERTHWSKDCSTIQKQKTQRSPANQANQEQRSPSLIGCSRNEKASEHAGNPRNFSAQRGRE
jgi:hypothetical protein